MTTSITGSLRDDRFVGAFTAITTPFTDDGSAIDYTRLEEQIEFQRAGGVRGIVVCGTTGESPTLSADEYEKLVARAVELGHAKGLLVIAGTGANSTAHAVEQHRYAARAGADGSLSVNPYYNKPTQEGLYRHFAAVADSADLPVMLYNIPGRTGVALSVETICRLAEHRRIVAVKEATGSVATANGLGVRRPDIAVLSGDDPMTLPYAAVGGVGVVSVASNVAPRKVADLCAAFLGGDFAGALRFHRELLDLCEALFLETNPIPVKAAMKLLGRDSGAMRLPMTPAGAGTVEALKGALKRHGLT